MQHLAIIPDGNRRWAIAHKLEASLGHKKGADTIRTAITACFNNGIKYLTLFIFSVENLRRSEMEKNYLFSLFFDSFRDNKEELIKNGIRVRFFGDERYIPDQIKSTIKVVQDSTAHLDKLNLSFLFCYGARQEIVHATQVIAQKILDGKLTVDQIDEKQVHDALWTAALPDPDLIIRTSGEVRLSNFLLFQAAYSEWNFLECFWPEITLEKLQKCIDDFKKIKRNFGQ